MLRQKCTSANNLFPEQPISDMPDLQTTHQFRSFIWKGFKEAGMQNMQQQLQERQLHISRLFFLGRTWLMDTINSQERGEGKTDRSLFLSMHKLGSLAMVLGTRFKRRHFITAWLCTLSLVECFGTWHRKADANAHGTLQVFQRYKDTNHSRFRKYTALEIGRHQESIRASHTLPLFVAFSGHKWTWNTV